MFKANIWFLIFASISINLLMIFYPTVHGACFQCNSTSNFACLSFTQYVPCNATALDLTIIHNCPATTVCNETNPLAIPLSFIPCYRNMTGSNFTALPGCNRPSVTLVENTTTAATTTTTTTTTAAPTTTTTTTTVATTTAAPAPFNPVTWCASRAVGRYRLPSSTTCKQYVNCYLANGMKGAIYTCFGSTLFDPSQGACIDGYTCA